MTAYRSTMYSFYLQRHIRTRNRYVHRSPDKCSSSIILPQITCPVHLFSSSFIVSLEVVTYGPQFDGPRANVRPQAERSWLLDRCTARMSPSSSCMQMHRVTACQTVQNRLRHLPLALTLSSNSFFINLTYHHHLCARSWRKRKHWFLGRMSTLPWSMGGIPQRDIFTVGAAWWCCCILGTDVKLFVSHRCIRTRLVLFYSGCMIRLDVELFVCLCWGGVTVICWTCSVQHVGWFCHSTVAKNLRCVSFTPLPVWHNGAMVRALDLQATGRRFDSQHFDITTTVGKLFTQMYLCHQAVKFGSSAVVLKKKKKMKISHRQLEVNCVGAHPFWHFEPTSGPSSNDDYLRHFKIMIDWLIDWLIEELNPIKLVYDPYWPDGWLYLTESPLGLWACAVGLGN